MQRLKTGVAYHGNRMLSHAISGMKDIAANNMDVVVHMLSHTDWERHSAVMKDIFAATEAEGLEVWVDNWGIGGAPGDRAHFLGYHPEAHMYYSDGTMHPFQACLNAPAYRDFVKQWVDTVVSIGGKTVFWDEPNIPKKKIEGTDDYVACCTCPTCQALFREKYGHDMPKILDAELAQFRRDSVTDFFHFATSYAHEAGLKNIICFMPHQLPSIFKNSDFPPEKILAAEVNAEEICKLKTIDNFGTDPYWATKGDPVDPYKYVYDSTKACVELTAEYKRDHHIWIQTFSNPAGRADEIISACEAAYDGGARTILAWGYRGSESNTYRAECTETVWAATKEGFRRIKDMDYDARLEANRKLYKK